MNLALAHSRARVGVHAPAVRVEVHLGGGLPNFTLVGLPATAVRESRERVRSAICNGQFEFPQRRITVNLAPADLPKEGGHGLGGGIDMPPVCCHGMDIAEYGACHHSSRVSAVFPGQG